MQYMKFSFVLVVALAAFAHQSNAAEIQRSKDRVDLRLFVNNAAAVVDIMYKNINEGLDKAKPHMDIMLNEVAPEMKAILRKYIDLGREKLRDEHKRLTFIFKTMNTTLDELKPIKSCADKVSPDAKKLALSVETTIAKTFLELVNKNKDKLEAFKTSFRKTLNKMRQLFDTEIVAVKKCLTPGRKDAAECTNKELDNILKGANTIAFEISYLIETGDKLFSEMIGSFIGNMMPLIKDTVAKGRVIIKTLGDCVSSLK